jgi:hypothetical protein
MIERSVSVLSKLEVDSDSVGRRTYGFNRYLANRTA